MGGGVSGQCLASHAWNSSHRPFVQMTRELTKEELSRLVVGPRVVDFGKVSMGSTNTLDTSLNVVLDLKPLEMLRESPSISQVIPPGARGAFPLVLQVGWVGLGAEAWAGRVGAGRGMLCARAQRTSPIIRRKTHPATKMQDTEWLGGGGVQGRAVEYTRDE